MRKRGDTIKGVMAREAAVKRASQAARGRALGASGKGRKKPTQAEKDEIADYLRRNPT